MSHCHCKHEVVKYCSHCNVCYCEKCGEEWSATTYYPYWTVTNPIITTDWACDSSGVHCHD